MTFEEFGLSHLKNAWVNEPGGLNLYFRKAIMNGADFDLANMNCDHPGKGALKAFLDKWEPLYTFHIENLLNDRLEDFFIGRGYTYTERSTLSQPCMIKRT